MTTIPGTLLVASLAVLIATAAIGLATTLLAGAPRATRPEATPVQGSGMGTPGALRGLRDVGGWATAGLLLALVLLLAALLVRTVLLGHAPWANLRDFSVAFAAALLATYLALGRTQPIAGLAPLAALLAAGIVGFALGLEERTDPLVPALQQPLLLTIHVGTAAIAYAIAGVAFLAAVGELAQRAASDRLPTLPSAGIARAVGHRAVLIGFPILTVAIVLGSVWANLAWRSYWSNDPKELAAAATWLVFGAYLHVAGRRDRWAALAPWLIVLGFAGVLFTYIGASLFLVGEHSYAAP
ncbi:MAG TPA: cytochrome c biogenesis protein CcsA [Candidatus Limnocylindria bacterium]|nr:cytochrome c biogenesis protein CcsA [Candidatus Limnocylindria bacterium]